MFSKDNLITILVGGGLVATFFGFALQSFVTPYFKHIEASNETVDVRAHVEQGRILIFVRNNSNDVIDLVKADIKVGKSSNKEPNLGVYPSISKVYASGTDKVEILLQDDREIKFTARILHVVSPNERDQFGFHITGLSDNTIAGISGVLYDLDGRQYKVLSK